MEILRPTLININGRVYRKNFVQEDNYDDEEEEDDFSYVGPPGRLCQCWCNVLVFSIVVTPSTTIYF